MKKLTLLIALGFLAASCQKVATLQEPIKSVETKAVVEATTTPEVLGTATTAPVEIPPTPKSVTPKPVVKTIIKTVDNSEAIRKAEQETENARLAQQQAEERAAQLQAQQDQIKQALDAAMALKAQQKQAAEQQAQQEAADLRAQIAQKQALLAQMKTECDNPINALKQQIIDIKSKYFTDLSQIGVGGGITTSYYNAKATQLLNDANTKIQDISNQINGLKLQCSIKFGN